MIVASQKLFRNKGKLTSPLIIRYYPDGPKMANNSELNKETLLIGGKAMNPVHAFVLKNKVPIVAVGGVALIFAVFGFKTPLVFVGQCIVVAVVFGVVGLVIFLHDRKRKVDLYPAILRELNVNRSKIESFIGSFEMPTKGDLHWQTGKTKEEGKQRDTVEYSIRLMGARGFATAAIVAVDVIQITPEFERKKNYIIENYSVELHGIGEGKEFGKLVLIDNPVPPLKVVTGTIIEEYQ
jgi:hypothetical protein